MLFDPARHELLRPLPWDESRARATIERIVAETESRFTEERYWPLHPLDLDDGDDPSSIFTPLYFGACGVFWALDYLQGSGAAALSRSYAGELDRLLVRNRAWLGRAAERERASFLMGATPVRLMSFGVQPAEPIERALEELIAGNERHPSRELMWGSPGTLLAALFLHERTGKERWAELFRSTAAALRGELSWSERYQCSIWEHDLYGQRAVYLGAVHGFAGTALPLIHGRHLLDAKKWSEWEKEIVQTVQRTAKREGTLVNWPPELESKRAHQKMLLQVCHGAPGLVIALADLPSKELDDLLLAAGETIWTAGPLTKGSNLCHGTGGNGYSFLKLYRRTGDSLWLERARSFAMHGIAQAEEHASRYGQWRHSLWTGDLGFAIYLWDCVRAEASFPTLDVFYAGPARAAGLSLG